MGVNSLPKTVIRQRRDCDLNPGPFAPESSTLTTRLPSHLVCTSASVQFRTAGQQGPTRTLTAAVDDVSIGLSVLHGSPLCVQHTYHAWYTGNNRPHLILCISMRPDNIDDNRKNPCTLSFQSGNLPFLQILPAVAFLFFFRTHSTDFPDCLPTLLGISVFYLSVILFFPTF